MFTTSLLNPRLTKAYAMIYKEAGRSITKNTNSKLQARDQRCFKINFAVECYGMLRVLDKHSSVQITEYLPLAISAKFFQVDTNYVNLAKSADLTDPAIFNVISLALKLSVVSISRVVGTFSNHVNIFVKHTGSRTSGESPYIL